MRVIPRLVSLLVGGALIGPRPAGRPLYRCAESGFSGGGLTVARTAGDWRALWRRSVRPDARGGCGSHELPVVDFARQMVLVVAYGRAYSSGYSVSVARVARRGDTTVVSVVRRAPGLGCLVTWGSTSPVVAVTASRTSGPVMLASREARSGACIVQ